MTNWNQIVFVTKLLLVKDSCNMGANNTIITASSSSSGAPRRPTSFLTRNTCFIFFALGILTLCISGKSFLQLQQLSFNTKAVTGTQKFSYTELCKANTGKWRKTLPVDWKNGGQQYE